jgi:hypothetical protein
MSIIYHKPSILVVSIAMGGSPIGGWFMMEKHFKTWMRTRGTPISRTLHIGKYGNPFMEV